MKEKYCMEEILQKANELGLMIKGSDIFKRYEELVKKIEADSNARTLLDEYIKMSEEIYKKESSGGVVEVEEKQKLQDLSQKVSENQLIKEFIATQSYYVNMMMQIQNTISNPKGDPIGPSKIIKPGAGTTGKIVTGNF